MVTNADRLEERLARLHAAYDVAPRASLAFELAAAAMTAGDAPALREWAATAERLATSAADPMLVAASRVLVALGDVWAGERAPAADLLAPLERLGDVPAAALLHVAHALLRLERIEDAGATLERAAAATGGEALVWLLGTRAWLRWLQLDLDGALAAAEAAEEAARLQAAPDPLLLALSVRAAIHHDRGETPAAERAAAGCAALIAALDSSATVHVAAATLASLHAGDDPERCLRELDTVELDPSSAGRAALIRVRAALAAGRIDRADRLAHDAAAHSARFALPLTASRAETGTAEILLAWGEAEAAAALAEVAAEAADALAALDAAQARLVQGRALAAAGDHEAAKAVLERVAADAARGSAVRLRDAASRELQALGARSPADGRRDEPAEVSEPQPENALARFNAKLGMRTRAQLAREWGN